MKQQQKPIILSDGNYRVAIPAKVVRWMRVCGFKLKYRNSFLLEAIR